MTLDISSIRNRFPALRRTVGGVPAAYLDGPGGTQVPESVIEAMAGTSSDASRLAGGMIVFFTVGISNPTFISNNVSQNGIC